MRFTEIAVPAKLGEGMAGDEHARPREYTILDCFFQSELGTVTVANGSEAPMQHLRSGVRLSEQVNVIGIAKGFGEVAISGHGA